MAKPRPGELLELRIDGLSVRGEGIAAHDAWTVSVPGALPGERVRARVSRVRRGRLDTRLEELLERSPRRVEARCRHFQECGGCTLQTLPYPAQLEAKLTVVRGLLEAEGLDSSLVAAPIGCASPFGYRNKMEFSFGRDSDGRTTVGLHPPGFKYEVFDLAECHLESPEAAAMARAVGQWARDGDYPPFVSMDRGGLLRTLTVREGKRTGDRLVELTTTADPAPGMAESFLGAIRASGIPVTSVYWTQHRAARGEPTTLVEHLLDGADTLREELHLPGQDPLVFEIHPRAFFQPNTLQAEVLYDRVLEAAALDRGDEHVLDLYCGTGTIGMALASRAGRITGIELVPDAVENARHNAAANGIQNIDLHAGDVAKVLGSSGISTADCVIVDPPRSGLLAAARVLITDLNPRRLVYVSCNPEALARDLVALDATGWTLHSIQPVDMFPNTAHIENVATLTRGS